MEMPVPPKRGLGGTGLKWCSAVSYFSARMGSIIGAGRLSFRVRDGSGRFPTAVAAVTLFTHFRVSPPHGWGSVLGGGVWIWFVVAWLRTRLVAVSYTFSEPLFWFLLCVSFRPVSASSLHLLLGF